MSDNTEILLNQAKVRMLTYLSLYLDANPNTLDKELKLLVEIFNLNDDSGNLEEKGGDSTQKANVKPTPKLIYNINERLQCLLALMAANRLSPKETNELVEIMTQTPSALHAVVKAQERGITGANAVFAHALQNVPAKKLNSWKKKYPSLGPELAYNSPAPFTIKPPRPDNT